MMALMLFMFYIVGLILIGGVTGYIDEDRVKPEIVTKLILLSGTLRKSIVSLFMGVTGGLDWGEIYHILRRIGDGHSFAFLFFIQFTSVVVRNVLAAMFVE